MTQAIRPIAIEHRHVSQPIAARSKESSLSLTLLDLVEAVSEVSDSEDEVIATVTYMLRSGRIRVAGEPCSGGLELLLH